MVFVDTEFDDAVTAINGIQVYIGIGNGLDQKVRQFIDRSRWAEFDRHGTRRDTEGRIFFFEIFEVFFALQILFVVFFIIKFFIEILIIIVSYCVVLRRLESS